MAYLKPPALTLHWPIRWRCGWAPALSQLRAWWVATPVVPGRCRLSLSRSAETMTTARARHARLAS